MRRPWTRHCGDSTSIRRDMRRNRPVGSGLVAVGTMDRPEPAPPEPQLTSIRRGLRPRTPSPSGELALAPPALLSSFHSLHSDRRPREDPVADNHDVVIIGGGPGGYAAALYGASAGLDVALVERAKVGGTCLPRRLHPGQGAAGDGGRVPPRQPGGRVRRAGRRAAPRLVGHDGPQAEGRRQPVQRAALAAALPQGHDRGRRGPRRRRGVGRRRRRRTERRPSCRPST